MLRELRDQSEVFDESNLIKAESRSAANLFEIHLHGPLDLLSEDGCQAPACRLSAADRLVRSLGLIADRLWLTDLLTERFVDFGRPTNEKVDRTIYDVIVLRRLLPLIRAGVVKFRSPWVVSCSGCQAKFNEIIEEITDAISKEFRSSFKVVRLPTKGYEVHVSGLSDQPLFFSNRDNSESVPRPSTVARAIVGSEVRSAMWVARNASLLGGSIFSSSRIGLAGLLESEGRISDKRSLLLLDEERSFNVPWVTDLDANQILQLRSEVSTALPVLREKILTALTASNKQRTAPGSMRSLISELREQSAEVRGELEAKRSVAARFWKGTYGILGLGLSAYGVATDQVVPGMMGLLPVIQLLMAHKSGHESDMAELKRKPGYVLVKAQDILAHADS